MGYPACRFRTLLLQRYLHGPFYSLLRIGGITIRLLGEWPMNRVSIPGKGKRRFLFLIAFRPALRSTKPPTQWITRIKRQENEDRQSPHQMPRLRMEKLYLNSPTRLHAVGLNWLSKGVTLPSTCTSSAKLTALLRNEPIAGSKIRFPT
jgi:hypothetical protein